MRTLILAALLAFASLCHGAVIPAANVALPAADFPSFEESAAVLSGSFATDDGRQVVVLTNGMAFVSMTDERIPLETPAGTILGVAHMLPMASDPDRRPYLFSIGQGRGRPQLAGYRVR